MKNKVFNVHETSEVDGENVYEDLEEWEYDAQLFDEQNWSELLEYRRKKAERNPDSLYEQWSLGEAYRLNKEYEKAISFLGDLHKKYPDDLDTQYSLLEALMAIGKDETAFEWTIQPTVIKLNKNLLDYCYDYLRRKRKPRTVHDVYMECYSEGYPMFGAEQLMRFLYSDDRFILTGSKERSFDCFIVVNRKK